MSKHPQQKPAEKPAMQPTAKLPGDHLSSAEERTSRESSLAQIKGELEAERIRNEAMDRARAAELAGSNVKLATLDETVEERERAHLSTIALVRAEMEAQASENPPRLPPSGIDEASIDLIREEMVKSRKRVVLPAG